MRVALFDHVQRLPISFFTRVQTGALMSRMSNDVIGAQQAVTNTIGTVVQNAITLGITLARDVRPGVAAHAAHARGAPRVHHPGAPDRAEAPGGHPRRLHPQRVDEQHHRRAVQRRRRARGEAVRQAGPRAGRVRRPRRAGPRHRRHVGDVLARPDGRARLRRRGRDRDRLLRRRPDGDRRHDLDRDARRARRCWSRRSTSRSPSSRTRGRRAHRARQLRAGVRGASTSPRSCTEKPGAYDLVERAGADRDRPRVVPAPGTGRQLAGLARGGHARPRDRAERMDPAGRLVHGRARRAGRARRTLRRGQDDHRDARAPDRRRRAGLGPHRRPRRA